jgi:hypothetical protein
MRWLSGAAVALSKTAVVGESTKAINIEKYFQRRITADGLTAIIPAMGQRGSAMEEETDPKS